MGEEGGGGVLGWLFWYPRACMERSAMRSLMLGR